MKRSRPILAVLLMVPQLAFADRPSLRVEVLLNEQIAKGEGVAGLVPDLDIIHERFLLLSASHQLYLLGWGGVVPVARPITGEVTSFAFSKDGLLFVVRDKELVYLDSNGDINTLFELPSLGMRITAGSDRMYLFEPHGLNGSALYAYFKGRAYQKILESPGPIEAVAESRERVLFSTGEAIYGFALGAPLQLLLVAPGKTKIRSIAIDQERSILYFSTATAIYALHRERVIPITREIGGLLKWHQGSLYVLSVAESVLLRLVGLPAVVTGAQVRSEGR
jgi:hypothetical protein